MTELYKGNDERRQMKSEMSTYYRTNMILLTLKIATLHMSLYQHEHKLIEGSSCDSVCERQTFQA